jgi:protein TonB
MRLALAGIPAAMITLLLFVLMQAMVVSPDRIPGQGAARNPVAFVSPFAPARGMSDEESAAQSLPDPAASLPPPVPEFSPPLPVPPVPAAPSTQATPASPPEFALDLGQLVLPKPPPDRTPSPRPQATRQAARPVEPVVRRPSPERAVTPASPTGQQTAKRDAPAAPRGVAAAQRADPAGGRSRAQAGNEPVEAVPVVRVEPEYPRKAARAGREGWVKLAFTITPSGGVTDVRVLESRPRRVFDRAARRALEQWRFRPQRIDGRALAREAVQVIEFKLVDRG